MRTATTSYFKQTKKKEKLDSTQCDLYYICVLYLKKYRYVNISLKVFSVFISNK